jgi:hypothetical protein
MIAIGGTEGEKSFAEFKTAIRDELCAVGKCDSNLQ